MSNIDWSKAPKGATHFNTVNGMFYRNSLREEMEFWNKTYWVPGGRASEYFGELVPRPSATQWTGPADGLPPVGTVCAFVRTDNLQKGTLKSGAPVTIIAHYKNQQGTDVAAFTYDVNDIRDVESAIAKCFRPIRTAEQLAAEAREKAIDELVRRFAINGHFDWYELFAQMYDAGVFNVKE